MTESSAIDFPSSMNQDIVVMKSWIKTLYLLQEKKVIHTYMDKNILDHIILLYFIDIFKHIEDDKHIPYLFKMICMLKREWISFIILQYNMDIDKAGEYALQMASIQKDISKVKYLVNIGVDINREFPIYYPSDIFDYPCVPCVLYDILSSRKYPFIVHAAFRGFPLDFFIPDLWTHKEFYGIILSCAIINKDKDTITLLIKSMGIYFIHCICFHDYLPLKCAKISKYNDLIRLMLDNIIEHYGYGTPNKSTLLDFVIMYGDMEMCKTVGDKTDVSVNHIKTAILNHRNEMAVYLIVRLFQRWRLFDEMDNIMPELLEYATINNNLEMTLKFLQGIRITPWYISKISWSDNINIILTSVSIRGHLDILKEIIKRKGLTVPTASIILREAINCNRINICHYIFSILDSKNIDSLVQYCDKEWGFWYALVQQGRAKILSLLIDRGGKLIYPDYLLYMAVLYNRTNTAQILIHSGARCRWYYGNVYMALSHGNLDMIKMLVTQGNAYVTNNNIAHARRIQKKDSDIILKYLIHIKRKYGCRIF